MARLCSMEHGGALTHKHFQMVMKGNPPVLNKKIKVCLGWDVTVGHVVSGKRLRDEGLHTSWV